MGYEIRIVSNEEFDTLPYKGAKNSLGLADAENGIAYVRETGVRDLDQATIDHEFDELIAKISPHEEDGIRYKSGGSLGSILAPIAGAAITILSGGSLTPLGVAVGGLGTAGTSQYSKAQKPEKYGQPGQFGDIALSALKGGASAYLGGKAGLGFKEGVTAAGQQGAGLGGKLVGGLKGAIGLPTTKAATTTTTGAPMTLASGGAPMTAAPLTGTTAATGAQVPMTLANASVPMTAAGTAGTVSTPAIAGGTTGASSLLKTFGEYGTKAAKSAAGNLATQSIIGSLSPQQTPTLAPAERTPVSGTGAIERFIPNLNLDFNVEDPFVEAVTQEQFDVGRKNIALNQAAALQNALDYFRTIRPGATPETDTALASRIKNINLSRTAELENLRKQAEAANVTKRGQYEYANVKKANKLSDQQMSFYINLANASDAEIRKNVANDPNEFRQIFGGLTAIG